MKQVKIWDALMPFLANLSLSSLTASKLVKMKHAAIWILNISYVWPSIFLITHKWDNTVTIVWQPTVCAVVYISGVPQSSLWGKLASQGSTFVPCLKGTKGPSEKLFSPWGLICINYCGALFLSSFISVSQGSCFVQSKILSSLSFFTIPQTQ